MALPEGSEMHLEYFYKAKKANYYLKADPLTTTLNLYLGSEESTLTTRHNLKVFRNYVTNDPKVLNTAWKNEKLTLIQKYFVKSTL